MLLEKIDSPADIRALSYEQLATLASEIRTFIVNAVSVTGGHLGSNLGVVELTFALHRVFDSPRDILLWDTGHQAYVHKILTGRRERFTELRQPGGLSGYPSRAESEHDWVENSHASTILSYAHGVATSLHLSGAEDDRRVIAVIGDGSMTGGMAFEALGVRYVGPVNGHDVAEMEHVLRQAAAFDGPIVVHMVTRKGKGYPFAEDDEEKRLRDAPVFDPVTGPPEGWSAPSGYTQAFSEALLGVAQRDPRVVAITAAMPGPTGLLPFQARFPDRFFDVGIAEQHAVTAAAGMAMGGLRPVVAVYSTFLTRAMDQVTYDVGLHRLPVIFCLDRAGITGPDGASAHGVLDLALF